jgi:hypothetical protein
LPASRKGNQAYGDAIMSNEPKLQEFYAMISGMRVLSLPRTVTRAEKIMKATVDTYLPPVACSFHRGMLTPTTRSQLLGSCSTRRRITASRLAEGLGDATGSLGHFSQCVFRSKSGLNGGRD